MARMWPQVIPAEVRSDPRRGTEIEVYRKLKGDLDDTWEVYYSRPWWGIGPKGGEIDGEADFIVAHADAGILFIEVKGGTVRYLPERDQWTSRDSHGIDHKIKDPVKQAMVCKHRFKEKLSAVPGWPRGIIRLRHGVILPDSGDPGAGIYSIGGNPRDLFCFAEQFSGSLKTWVESRLLKHPAVDPKPEIPPGRTGVDLLRRLVADPVRLRVPFRRAVQSEVAELDRLVTVQQLHAITLLESIPRALIEGGAGTGKTMLATEMAARISDEGRKVCLICYNAPLAVWLQILLRERPAIDVSTFHAFCIKAVRDAGLQVEPDATRGTDYYGTILPEMARRALTLMPSKRWDAIIVDEGQDFQIGWWSVIESALKEPGKGILRVFLDSNQAVYGNTIASLRFDAQPFVLRHNLRNTREIVKVTEPLYTGPPITPLGPQGEPPVMAEFRSMGESLLKAAQLAGGLVRDESISADDLAILLPAEEHVEKISAHLVEAGLKHTRAHEAHTGSLVVDTIRRFKGLEAAVVVMVVDRESAENRELGYVGVSRAKSRLFIMGDFRDTLLERAILQGRDGRR